MPPVKCAPSKSCVPPPMGAVGVTLKDRDQQYENQYQHLKQVYLAALPVVFCLNKELAPAKQLLQFCHWHSVRQLRPAQYLCYFAKCLNNAVEL